MDRKTSEQRHFNMAAIHGKNTKPEILVRKYLFARGLRFRIHDKKLPGCPDIVLPKYRTVIFVNGCFWHGHEGCRFASIPATNTEFWTTKIDLNKNRDFSNRSKLESMGWNVLTVWTCEIRNKLNRTNCLGELYNSIMIHIPTVHVSNKAFKT